MNINAKNIFRRIIGNEVKKEKEQEEGKKDLSYSVREENKTALEKVREVLEDKEIDFVWAFMAGKYKGQHSQDFRGNLKYLFVYINKYRPDLEAYWLASEDDTLNQVRELGYHALKLGEAATQYAINHTGVLVADQVKISLPQGFENVKYLNLWHGVGFKHIERGLLKGDIALELAQKYIRNNSFYRDHQLMVVTSPMIEKEFMADCGLDEDKLIRAGYFRCLYQQNFDPVVTYEHDLRKVKGLSRDTKLVVYAPTYRASGGGTFAKAICDIEKLYQCSEENNLLLIFKVHPHMEKEIGFLRAWETYGDRKHFWFWDNQYDFYEIMDQIDVAIIDYSAIFSDMVAMGIRHYIRYIFDYEEYTQEGFTQNEYFERTLGTVCYTFDDLLNALSNYELADDSAEFDHINDIFWSYSEGKNDFENVIQKTLDFKIKERKYPTLYSFDIFDTLFSRKVLEPTGIFCYVQEKMQKAGDFPTALTRNYLSVRHSSEFNVRDWYRKSQDIRHSDHIEISFDEIFERMADVYNLSQDQVQRLKEWELEAELDNVVPLTEQINELKHCLASGDQVVLISDMYLPADFIKKMLAKADPMLETIPLFVSSEYGVQKTTNKLYFEVYKSFEPFYDFKEWIHYGDNTWADQTKPRQIGIYTRLVDRPVFNYVQRQMVEEIATYDSYLVAAMQTRLYNSTVFSKDEFVCSYVALCLVPYVDWALRDALRRGYKTVYFISRDGHPLKKIADAIIEKRNIPLKTKYIYASRSVWRVPSYIDDVDDGFWQIYGNFLSVRSKENLFRAMELDEDTFCRMFPAIDPDTIEFTKKSEFQNLLDIFKSSAEYREYLLKRAAQDRVLASGYLKQEIDFHEKFAIIEYWGRGYTQDCMVRLCQNIEGGRELEIPFYYSRSIEPTMGGAIRHDFITNDTRPLFVESIFANIPYKTIEKYEIKEGKIVPVIVPGRCDLDLYDSMERMLPEFARQYVALELHDPEETDRMLYEFALDYYEKNKANEKFAEDIGPLMDSVATYGREREYAPPYTMQDLDRLQQREFLRGADFLTTCISMSLTRAEEDVRERYREMYQLSPEDDASDGYLLTEELQKENRKYHDMYKKLRSEAIAFRKLYEEAVEQNPLESNRVLFVGNGKSITNGSVLGMVCAALQEREDLKVESVCMQDDTLSMEDCAYKVAMAKYIVVVSAVSLFCKIKFRSGTEEILLNSSPFHFYNQGFQIDYPLSWKKKYMKFSAYNDISVLQIPSQKVENIYRKSYITKNNVKCSLTGCCITDKYFDDNFAAESKRKLKELFPQAGDRKIILYIPSVKTRSGCSDWMDLLDLDVLNRLIGNRYAVVVQMNKAEMKGVDYKNQLVISGFSKWIQKGISPQALLTACDVIVGDYRDIFYQAPFVHKPTYSTAYDYERQFIWSKNLTLARKNYKEILFCPIVKSSAELAEELAHIESYDYGKMEQFFTKYMGGCDGRSINRVVEYILAGIGEGTEN